MKRGDLVTIAAKGPYTGKPRPCLIVQSDAFTDRASVTVALLTTTLTEPHFLRIPIEPTPQNGLKTRSQIAIDHLVTVPRENIGRHIGQAGPDMMWVVDRTLSAFLDLI